MEEISIRRMKMEFEIMKGICYAYALIRIVESVMDTFWRDRDGR